MKIGIVTFRTYNNYGTILQSFALQNIIKSLSDDIECKTVDYWDEVAVKNYSLIRRPPHMNFSDYIKYKIIPLPFRLFRQYYFWNFTKRYIELTERCYDAKTLNKIECQFDCFICGSDVIWSNQYHNYDGAYYLDFTKKKKISYAASFGKTKHNEKDKLFEKGLIPSIDFVSCREDSGTEYIRSYCEKNAVTVLDPTLVLGGEFWNKMKSPGKMKKSKGYILLYSVHRSELLKKSAEELKEIMGLSIVKIGASIKESIGGG